LPVHRPERIRGSRILIIIIVVVVVVVVAVAVAVVVVVVDDDSAPGALAYAGPCDYPRAFYFHA
jgi:flagellar basal body-associated protein FliL